MFEDKYIIRSPLIASEHFLQKTSWKTFQMFWHLPRSIGVETSEFQHEQVPFKKIAVPFSYHRRAVCPLRAYPQLTGQMHLHSLLWQPWYDLLHPTGLLREHLINNSIVYSLVLTQDRDVPSSDSPVLLSTWSSQWSPPNSTSYHFIWSRLTPID